jgi:hypothetical protein
MLITAHTLHTPEKREMKCTGSVFSRGKGKAKTWWARFSYTDEEGVRHDLQRKATSKANARYLADDLASQREFKL